MALPKKSNLWIVGDLVRTQLLNEAENAGAFDVMLDTPAAASKRQQASTGETLVNLFFYRIEPSGFYEAAGAHERWYVRLFCLVTVFSSDQTGGGEHLESGGVTPQGEIDLRVLGEVLRFFHENPVIDGSDEMGARLEVVLNALSSQEINQIWSTQGDVPYRPSLLYEMALMPIDPKDRASPPLPVVAGGARAETYGNMKLRNAKVSDLPHAPGQSPYMEAGSGTDWVPALSFVKDGAATQSLSVASGTPVALWIAGPIGGAVTLVWQKIEDGVWKTILESPQIVPTQSGTLTNGVIDPSQAGGAQTLAVTVPGPTTAMNLLLFAQRRAGDGAVLSTSNPLIVTITRSSGP